MKNTDRIHAGLSLRGLLIFGSGLAVLIVALGSPATAKAVGATEVPPVDLGKFSPGDFNDDELLVPYYLEHLHEVANSIPLEGPNRGSEDGLRNVADRSPVPGWRRGGGTGRRYS